MATIKEVMDEIATVGCSVAPPASWLTATSTTHVQLKGFLRRTVEELLDRVDWPSPITQETTITGSGAEEYALPSDFKRLTYDDLCVYETTTTRRAGIPVTSNGAWTYLNEIGSAGGDRYYRVQGDEVNGFTISFYRNPGSGESITVSYVSRNWVQMASGTKGDSWTAATDLLLLDREIVSLGVEWRFKKKKGLPFADIMADYEMKLSRKANESRGLRRINMGGPTMRSPFDIPVPDYIPSS